MTCFSGHKAGTHGQRAWKRPSRWRGVPSWARTPQGRTRWRSQQGQGGRRSCAFCEVLASEKVVKYISRPLTAFTKDKGKQKLPGRESKNFGFNRREEARTFLLSNDSKNLKSHQACCLPALAVALSAVCEEGNQGSDACSIGRGHREASWGEAEEQGRQPGFGEVGDDDVADGQQQLWGQQGGTGQGQLGCRHGETSCRRRRHGWPSGWG